VAEPRLILQRKKTVVSAQALDVSPFSNQPADEGRPIGDSGEAHRLPDISAH
jgi:hypothetical protein